MCEVSERIYREGIEEGKAKGRAEGIAEGRAQGKAEGKLESQKETAKRLAEIGMTMEDIAKVLKVSVQMVREWLSGSVSPAR